MNGKTEREQEKRCITEFNKAQINTLSSREGYLAGKIDKNTF